MDWRWGHGRGGAHGGGASGMNRARALGFGGFGSALLRRSGRRARAEEGEGRVKWRVHERVARRWLEVEDNGQQLQISHGAWQRDQRSGDMCHPRGVCCLMNVSHCRSHSDNGNRLTAPVRR